MFRFQDIDTLEYIEDAEDKDGVAKAVVVNVPVESILVIFLGPYKQGKNLNE